MGPLMALTLGGAALGGLSGLLKKKPGAISLQKAKQRKGFNSGLGKSTADGFTYNKGAVPGQQQAAQTSGNQLNQLLSSGLAVDPARQQRYQDAYYASRAPDLIRQQQSQTNRLANARAASGRAGSMAAILGSSALQDNQARQLAQLQNQSVLGGEALANQALQQDIARAGVYNTQLQQLFANQINAQSANQNAYNAQAGLDLSFANQNNTAAARQFKANEANRNFSRFGNIMQGAIGGGLAGFNVGQNMGGGSGGAGSSGGGGGTPFTFDTGYTYQTPSVPSSLGLNPEQMGLLGYK